MKYFNLIFLDKLQKTIFNFCVLLLVGLFFFYLYAIFQRIQIPYGGLDRVEDNVLYIATQLSQGKTIYSNPAEGPLNFVGYGPVHFYLLVPLIKLFGTKIWLGRIVSIIASFFIGLRIFSITKENTKNFKISFISALLFYAFYGITKSQYDVGRLDLFYTWLLIEALIIAFKFHINKINKVIIIILSIIIFYTKQPGLLISFGFFIYFLKSDKKFALFYLLSIFSIGVLMFFILQFQTNGWFKFWLFDVRVGDSLSISTGLIKLLSYIQYLPVILVSIIYYYYYLLRFDRKEILGYWPLMSIIIIISCMPSIMIPEGDVNNLIPMGMIFCILFGIALNKYLKQLSEKINNNKYKVIIWSALLIQIIFLSSKQPKLPNKYDYNNIDKLTKYVQSVSGDIYVGRNPSLAFLNNKKVYDDSAMINAWNKRGFWESERLLSLFNSKHFALVFTRLTYEPDILKDAILSNYKIIDEIDNKLANMSYPYKILSPINPKN